MPIEILMPALSPTMTEGNLAKWLKKEGDSVESGDILCEIETDKATMEVEAVDEGIMGKIVVADGTENVAVNSLIALLLEDGEDASALEGAGASAPAALAVEATPALATATPAVPSARAAPVVDGNRVFASPLARRMAANESLDLSKITGTGPRGRIVKKDIEGALAAGTGKAEVAPKAPKPSAAIAPSAPKGDDPIFAFSPEFEAIPNSSMRKIIASRLTESARDVPHFNLQIDVEVDKLLALRKELNSRDGADYKISVNDFIVKASALALKKVPACNVSYTDDAILQFKRVDMAIAVAIEGGLITPVIRDAAGKGLSTLSNEAKALAGKARDGKLMPEEFQGGTFTISNLGMFGIKTFTSIINQPQGGILSVGAGEQRPVVKDGALAIATVVSLNMAIDHRCIDGATGAAFLKELKALIEDPIALML